MSLGDIKALTFDTGGTILDWHTGFSTALADVGAKYGLEKDWPAITNELRRRSLGRMLNLGEHEPPHGDLCLGDELITNSSAQGQKRPPRDRQRESAVKSGAEIRR